MQRLERQLRPWLRYGAAAPGMQDTERNFMKPLLRSLALVVITWSLGCACAFAQDRSLLPKYGAEPKSEVELAADAKFLATMDQGFGGDRNKASQQVAALGWKVLREQKPAEAMRRFNQAWLLNRANAQALWGMAAVQGMQGKSSEALALFREAALSLDGDLDFAVDYARTLGFVAVETKDDALLQQAFARFDCLHKKAPQHTLNLQNWAVTLYSTGNYADAWAKVQLAEATPRREALDPAFIAALQQKMPRP